MARNKKKRQLASAETAQPIEYVMVNRNRVTMTAILADLANLHAGLTTTPRLIRPDAAQILRGIIANLEYVLGVEVR